MKVFLSWSGDLSHGIALVLRDWLPCVINACEPYVSSADVDKGARWSSDIARALEECSFGILCVTVDNVVAPWLNFEAGALSKHIEKTHVCPLLYGVKKSDISGPLLQFQLTSSEKSDLLKLLITLNKASGSNALTDQQVNYVFEKLWPDLETKLSGLTAATVAQAVTPTTGANRMLEELLELVRAQHKLLRSPEILMPPDYIGTILSRSGKVAAGVPYDYPAWRDLKLAIDAARVSLKRLAEGTTVQPDEVQTIVLRITEPAEILLRKANEIERRIN